MPQYEFFCKACKKAFSKILTLAEYEKDKFKCPKCHGNKVEQRLSPVYAVRNTSTSKGHDQMYLKNPWFRLGKRSFGTRNRVDS